MRQIRFKTKILLEILRIDESHPHMLCRLALWRPLGLCEDVHKKSLTDIMFIYCGELDNIIMRGLCEDVHKECLTEVIFCVVVNGIIY